MTHLAGIEKVVAMFALALLGAVQIDCGPARPIFRLRTSTVRLPIRCGSTSRARRNGPAPAAAADHSRSNTATTAPARQPWFNGDHPVAPASQGMSAGKPGLFQRAQQAEQRGNREVRDLWARYQGHRQRLTAELVALAPGGRLCLLGAGNANDLDLDTLAARFDEIHLVDLDPAALARARGRQSAAVRAKLRDHAPVDLSGLYHQLDHRRLPAADALVAAGTTDVLGRLPAGFDVVASCCVLSQMSWALETLASAQAPLEVLQQVLLRVHLRTMLGLLAPTGAALLTADLVSSNVYPLDELGPDEDLRALAQKLAADRLAYPVCNPELIRLTMRHDELLAHTAVPPQLGQPWLWTGPRGLTYLVCPLVLRLRS
jgi:hypothetical protein